MSERVRIHKALADAGVASRRKSEALVNEGRVAVNGVVAGVGQTVDPLHDTITVDGRPIERHTDHVYLLLAKPIGVTSTVSDSHASRTVVDLIPADLRGSAARIYPVGRLDRDSEGLLLLTNDGAWANRMLHPRHGVEREYAIGLEQPLNRAQREGLEAGVRFDEGRAELANLMGATPADVRLLARLVGPSARDLVWYRATLQQGMKRQLRRMFAAVGAPVKRLVRVRVGTLRINDMALGDIRSLTAAERSQMEALVNAGVGRKGLVVSIDGPGGSGKSTVGAGAAARLGYRFCDTGVLYRGLTWLALERGVNPDDAAALVALIPEMELAPDKADRYVHLRVGPTEVTDQLHTPAVDREVSRVSRHAEVRAQLLPIQRALASAGRIIMAGRDIGSVILPDADLKIYLDVSVAERARRRAAERGELDDPGAVGQIEDDLRRRDGIDSTRATAPLRVPAGATIIETEGNTLEQTVDRVVAVVRRRERELAAGTKR
jgi:23S rRNA pseudouridine2605 synthase